MFNYGNNTITYNEGLADYDKLGEIRLSDYKNLPLIRMMNNDDSLDASHYDELMEYVNFNYG